MDIVELKSGMIIRRNNNPLLPLARVIIISFEARAVVAKLSATTNTECVIYAENIVEVITDPMIVSAFETMEKVNDTLNEWIKRYFDKPSTP